MSEPILRLAGVRKSYGGAPALAHLDLSIARGSFFTLLGPSGSGKTTTLRLIAGFEFPDAGTIHLDGREISGTPSNRRDVNTVFQDYALFPHMTLLENVAYGLLAKRVARPEAIERAQGALAQVQLDDYATRKPAQLSGGQRQRVALARAIVNRPSVLLLDEPLGALDLKLRHQMQVELKALQAQTGITFVYVTHDQEEALTMSDRVAVFRQGRIEQEGTPMEIYERPANEFVADFVGTSSLLRRQGQVMMLRPEKVGIHEAGAPPPPDAHVEPALVRGSQYLGMETRVTLELGDGARLLARCPGGAPPIPAGARVLASWHPGAAYILPVPAT